MSDELDARAAEIRRLLSDPARRPSRRFLRNPELRKNLDRLYTAIRDIQRLRRAGPLSKEQEEALAALVPLVTTPLTLDADALGLELENVDEMLVEAGDDQLVDSMLAIEYARDRDESERTGPNLTWSKIYGDRRPTKLDDKKCCLSVFLRARHSLYAVERAREATKAVRLFWLALVLGVLVAVFIVIAGWVAEDASWREALLVALAGALGATLAGVFKLRDALPRLVDLRTFSYTFPLHIPLGAVAGLFLWVVLESGIVDVAGNGDDWAVSTVLGFVAGFSEPFVLKTIEQIAGRAGEQRG